MKMMNKRLREENVWLSEVAQKYGFGRIAEMSPIKSNADGVGWCLAKYLTKSELPESWGRCRSYELCGEVKKHIGSQFQWVSSATWMFRRKLEFVADYLHFDGYEDFAEFLGPRWFHYIREEVNALRMPYHKAMSDPRNYKSGCTVSLFRMCEKSGFRRLNPDAWTNPDDYQATKRALESIHRRCDEILQEQIENRPLQEVPPPPEKVWVDVPNEPWHRELVEVESPF